MSDDISAIVIDNGSYSVKCGIAGDDAPKDIFESLVSTTKYKALPNLTGDGTKVGDDAQNYKGISSIKYPIEHGIITNWDE